MEVDSKYITLILRRSIHLLYCVLIGSVKGKIEEEKNGCNCFDESYALLMFCSRLHLSNSRNKTVRCTVK